jgi:hypothetical protein
MAKPPGTGLALGKASKLVGLIKMIRLNNHWAYFTIQYLFYFILSIK